MSLKFSPAITYPNTRYYIDLGNRRCYREGINNTVTGSPTTVFDLSPLKLTGQVYNGRYTDAFGGAVYFTGGFPSRSYFLGTLRSLVPFVSGLSAFTLSFWYNADNVKETQVLHKFGGTTDGGIIVFLEDNYINIELYCFRNNLYTGLKQRFFTTANQWHNFTFNWYKDAPYLVSFHDGDTSENLTTLILNNTASIVPLSTFKYNGEILDPNTFTLITSSLTYVPRFCTWANSGYLRQNFITSAFVLSLTGYLNSILYTSNYTFTKEDVKDYYESNRSRYAVNSNNQIVKNGLICHLDAGNPNSYTGTNLLNDISYNENDATLINGPSAANINEGIIRLDGVDEKISITTNSIRLSSKQPFTRMFWVKYNNINNTGYDDVNLLSDDLYLGSKLKYNTNTQTLCSIHSLKNTLGDLYLIQTNCINENLSTTYFGDFKKVSNLQFDDIHGSSDLGSAYLFKSENKLYGLGLDFNCFGVGREVIVTQLTSVNVPFDFVKVLAFNTLATFISAARGIYFAGYSGYNSTNIEAPTFTPLSAAGFNFDTIESGVMNNGYFFGLSSGILFSSGYREWIQSEDSDPAGLGGSGFISSQNNFTRVTPLGYPTNFNYKFDKTENGRFQSFALSGKRMFATGEYLLNGLGEATGGAGVNRFTLLSGNWDRVICNIKQSYALSADTNIWFSTGYNEAGELGLGDYNPRSEFTRIPGEFIDMYPCNTTVFAISTNKKLFYTGYSPGYDYNYPSASRGDQPQKVNIFTQFKDYEFDKLSTGGSKFPESYGGSTDFFYWNRPYWAYNDTPVRNKDWPFIPPIFALKKNVDYRNYITATKVNELSSWNLIVQSYDPSGYSKLYVIGKEKTQIIEFPLTDLVFSNNTNNLTFGQEGVSLDVGPIMMYNRELSHNEIIQNFNATKDRFLESTSLTVETQNNYILIAQLI